MGPDSKPLFRSDGVYESLAVLEQAPPTAFILRASPTRFVLRMQLPDLRVFG